MTQTKRKPITIPHPEVPNDEAIRRMRDVVLETLLDTQLGADILGELVRLAWVAWAREQPEPKASWLTPWDQLGPADQEADRRIGLAIARYVVETLIRVSYPTRRQQTRRTE